MRRIEAYSYGCLMARIPEPLAGRVRDFADSIPTERLRPAEGTVGGRAEEIHITIKYGIKTVYPDDVMDSLEGVEPFNVVVGRCGVFHNPDCVVLKIGVESPGLVSLNRLVCAKLPHIDTYGEYRPHITVAYLVKDLEDPYYYRTLQDDSLEGEKFGIDQVEFSTPGGNRYILPLNGQRAMAAKRTTSAERVAGMVLARLDVRVSPMEGKVEVSDGRQRAFIVGKKSDVERLARDLRWEITRISRMSLKEAREYIDKKMGSRRFKWNITREK